MLSPNNKSYKIVTLVISYIIITSCNNVEDKNISKVQDSAVNAEPELVNTPSTSGPNEFNNLALFISGVHQDSDNGYKSLEGSNYWKNFSKNLTTKFKSLDSTRYKNMRQWRNNELKEINASTDKLFYPFSGPDFLNAYTFFPNAKEYTMLALEPPGKLPTISELNLDTANNYFASIENGLKAILSFSFFRTVAMEKDFASKELNGAIHLVTLFVIKTGNKILDVKPATINKNGEIIFTDLNDCAIKGFRISFEDVKTHETKIINYFSLDVSDEGLLNNFCFKAFVGKMTTVTTYLKSASYLLHNANFSFMRNTILAKSDNILQDDSGVPIAFVKDSTWNRKFYGTYDKPINLFRNKFQPNLFKIYNDSLAKISIPKLDFGIGYDYKKNESNLMLFRKKN